MEREFSRPQAILPFKFQTSQSVVCLTNRLLDTNELNPWNFKTTGFRTRATSRGRAAGTGEGLWRLFLRDAKDVKSLPGTKDCALKTRATLLFRYHHPSSPFPCSQPFRCGNWHTFPVGNGGSGFALGKSWPGRSPLVADSTYLQGSPGLGFELHNP